MTKTVKGTGNGVIAQRHLLRTGMTILQTTEEYPAQRFLLGENGTMNHAWKSFHLFANEKVNLMFYTVHRVMMIFVTFG